MSVTRRAVAVLLLLPFTLASAARADAPEASAIARLRAQARGPLSLSTSPATGLVRFARPATAAARLPQPRGLAKQASPETRALAFLSRHGKAFGVTRPAEELVLDRRLVDADGSAHVSYRQVHHGVPVFGAVLRVHLDPRGIIAVVNGTLVPAPGVEPAPRLSAEAARAIVGANAGELTTRGAVPRLVVFRAGLVRGVPGTTHLAWEVPVGAGGEREHVYVDAHDGKIIDRIDVSPEALRREIYLTTPTAANLKWSEGQALPYSGSTPTQNDAINDLVAFTGDAYDFFAALGGRDSWNGSGATLRAVYESTGIEQCPNANWNGSVTNYCAGLTQDDVVAHEWGHAYTQGTHDLVYQWQPGALNESYSDIWGETVDQLNGAGLDEPSGRRSDGTCSRFGGGGSSSDNSYRWLLGETSGNDTLRDMWSPTCRADPSRVRDIRYHCGELDSGGVHTNSGVPNHTYALLVDGGSFNGQSVGAIGLVKASHIYWRAAAVYQGPTSDFADHADALEQSCSDLRQAGTNLRNLTDGAPSGQVITAADCTNLGRAIAAAELRAAPDCNWQPILVQGPPALCPSGAPVTLRRDSFDGGDGGWTRSHEGVYAEYTPFDWQLDSSLPADRTGTAFYAFDTVAVGDCVPGSDDQSGVVRLTSPAISVPAGSSPRLAFEHYVATEAEYDGGNLKVSVNSGPYQTVPGTAFRFNGYNDEITESGNDNPLAGEPAFTGTDEGTAEGSWGQSLVDLGALVEAGDSFRLRYDFGVDGCNGVDGWYVDDVHVYSCTSGGSTSPCVAGPNTLCLLGKRYKVELDWENQFNGARGRGLALPSTDFAGMFAFTDKANVEIMVKLLDFNGIVKAFYGQLTDLRFTMRVTDTRTGALKTYGNGPGNCGAIDQAAFTKVLLADGGKAATSSGAAACVASANRLCLLGGRFQVEVDWHNQYNGASGRGGALKLSDLSGTFSFGDPRNTELLTKTLDFGNRILFIFGALSDLGYTVHVTDTSNGAVKTYVNPPGRYCGGLDNDAF